MIFNDSKALLEQLQQQAVLQQQFELRDAIAALLDKHGNKLEGVPLEIADEDIFADEPISPLNIIVVEGAFG